MEDVVLKLEGVSKSFAKVEKDEITHALGNIDLEMHSGEFMPARLGSSGGKKRMSAGAFLRKYPQIDLVLGGHSHQEGAGKQVASSWYIQAPALSGGAAVAEILYDKKKRRIVSLKSRIAYAADAEPDAETAEMLAPLLEQSRRKGTRRIARMAFPLEPLKKSGAGNRLSRIFGRAMMRETGAEIALHGTLSSYRASPGILYASQVYLLAPYEKDKAGAAALLTDFRAVAAAGLRQSPHAPVQGDAARRALRLADAAIQHLGAQVNPKIVLSMFAAKFRAL